MSVLNEALFAFGAGVATFFSPCVFALLPGYVGYYTAAVESETAPVSGAFSRGVAASVGALATFAALSVVAIGATEFLEGLLPVVEPLVGLALIGLGVAVIWRGDLSLSVALPERRTSILGFGVFGAVYALAATACVLPLFLSVTVLSLDLSVAATSVVLGAYAGGFVLLMLSATVAIAVGRQSLLDRFRGAGPTLTRAAGGILVFAGLAQLYIAFYVAPIG